MTKEENKIDDTDFKGFYSPNVDINVKNGIISANYNYYISDEEKEDYKKKYGVPCPYKTSNEFRNRVYTYVMAYMAEFVRRANNGEIDYIKESEVWKAVDSFIATFTVAAAAYGIYDAIKCCNKIMMQLAPFIEFKIMTEFGNNMKKIVTKWKDDAFTFKNPKQDRLVDNKTYNLVNILNLDNKEKVNIKTIRSDRYSESSLLNTILDLDKEVIINWRAIENIPSIEGNLLVGNNSNDIFGMQKPVVIATQKVPVTREGVQRTEDRQMITLEDTPIIDPVTQQTHIRTSIKLSHSLGEGIHANEDLIISLLINEKHIVPESVKEYHIARESIGGEHIVNGSVDEGNICDGCVEQRHFEVNTIHGDYIGEGAIKEEHIVNYSIDNSKIFGEIESKKCNISIAERISQNVKNDIKLTEIKDSSGDDSTARFSNHFKDENKTKLRNLKLFDNRFIEKEERYDEGIYKTQNSSKLALSTDYFEEFEKLTIQNNTNGDAMAMRLEENYYKYLDKLVKLRADPSSKKISDFVKFIGTLQFRRQGDFVAGLVQITGNVKLKNNLDMDKDDLVICKVEGIYLNYHPIHNLCFSKGGKYIVHYALKNGEILLEKVTDHQKHLIKKLDTLFEFDIDLKYTNFDRDHPYSY